MNACAIITINIRKESAADIRKHPPLTHILASAFKLRNVIGNCDWGQIDFVAGPDQYIELVRELLKYQRFDVLDAMKIRWDSEHPRRVMNLFDDVPRPFEEVNES